MTRKRSPRFVLCLKNDDYRASLIARRIYHAVPDAEAERRGLLRVVDESGEDYLYPEEMFIAVDLPTAVARAFREEPANKPLQRTASGRR